MSHLAEMCALRSVASGDWILPLGFTQCAPTELICGNSPAMAEHLAADVISTHLLRQSSGRTELSIGSYEGNLHAISPSGSPLWSFAAGGPIGSSPSIDVAGTIYIGRNTVN